MASDTKSKKTSRHRTVRSPMIGFKTEKCLVSSFVAAARSHRSAGTRLIRTEFNSTNGIADIVQVTLRANWRSNIALGRILPQWAYALREIPYRRHFSTEYFQEMSGASRENATAILRRFTELNYCIRVRPGYWAKRRQPVPLIKEIVAIEAKLTNWRRVLGQAYRHLDYAHRSWVLMDGTRADPAIEHLAHFKRLNIGLITLVPQQRPRVWFTPAKYTPKSNISYWHANAELARRLAFQMSRVVAVDDI